MNIERVRERPKKRWLDRIENDIQISGVNKGEEWDRASWSCSSMVANSIWYTVGREDEEKDRRVISSPLPKKKGEHDFSLVMTTLMTCGNVATSNKKN